MHLDADYWDRSADHRSASDWACRTPNSALAGQRTRHGVQGGDVTPQPIDVGVFGGQGFVLTADHVPQPLDRVGQVHNGADIGRLVWTPAVQGPISI